MPFMYLISASLKLHSNCKIVGTHSFRHKSTNTVSFFTHCLWFDAISLPMNRSSIKVLHDVWCKKRGGNNMCRKGKSIHYRHKSICNSKFLLSFAGYFQFIQEPRGISEIDIQGSLCFQHGSVIDASLGSIQYWGGQGKPVQGQLTEVHVKVLCSLTKAYLHSYLLCTEKIRTKSVSKIYGQSIIWCCLTCLVSSILALNWRIKIQIVNKNTCHSSIVFMFYEPCYSTLN